MGDHITEQFCSGVRAAKRANADFPAFSFTPFLKGTLQTMTDLLPPIGLYSPLPHPDADIGGKQTRYALPLRDEMGWTEFWSSVGRSLKSDAVRCAVATALGIGPGIAMHPAVTLLRDLPGYKIRIHPDSKRKIATMQVYLASNPASPDIGARFYRPDGAGFIQTDACPYLLGAGYFFRRTDASWHGVNATTEQDGERNSLMLIYFDSPKASFS